MRIWQHLFVEVAISAAIYDWTLDRTYGTVDSDSTLSQAARAGISVAHSALTPLAAPLGWKSGRRENSSEK